MKRLIMILGAVLIALLILGFGGACGEEEEEPSAATPTVAVETATPTVQEEATPSALEETAETATYRMELEIGPTEEMLMPDEAQGATEGEIMVQLPGLPAPMETTTDQGYPVNHHLEVHIFDKQSGALVKEMLPTITITDQATGASRDMDVMAMYGVTESESDVHFGNNVYLSGTYTVAVTLGSETATFEDLTVSS